MYHQKSDGLIVMMKLVKTSGVKGTAGRRFLEGKAAQHGRLSMPTEFKKIKYQTYLVLKMIRGAECGKTARSVL